MEPLIRRLIRLIVDHLWKRASEEQIRQIARYLGIREG